MEDIGGDECEFSVVCERTCMLLSTDSATKLTVERVGADIPKNIAVYQNLCTKILVCHKDKWRARKAAREISVSGVKR